MLLENSSRDVLCVISVKPEWTISWVGLGCINDIIDFIISYHIISHHIISYHIISYHIISYHIISYHIISYHIISYHIISYHIISSYLIFSQNMLKIHKTNMLRGKIAKSPQEARKGLSPNLGKNTSNLPTKRNKMNLHYPSPPNPPKMISTSHQHTIINPVAHTPNTFTQKPKKKHQKQAKNQKTLHNYIIEKKICCPSIAF